MIEIWCIKKKIMKIIQNITHYPCIDKAFAFGEQVISISVVIASFAFYAFRSFTSGTTFLNETINS